MSDLYANPPILDELLAAPAMPQPVPSATYSQLAAASASTGPGTAALYADLPSIIKSLDKKQALYPQLAQAGINPAVIRSLQDLDTQRVLRGQRPLSVPRVENGQFIPGETLEVLKAMPTAQNPSGMSVQPQQEKTSITDIPGNALSDIATIFRSIPKIPAMLVKTATELPQAPRMFTEALSEGDFQKASQVPGVNLIPGVYTLGNLLEGDVQEIVKHPAMTALDVLPAATAKVFTAPASMLDEAGNLTRGASLMEQVFPKRYKVNLDEQAATLTASGETPKVSAVQLGRNMVRTAGEGKYEAILQDQLYRLRGSGVGRKTQSSFGSATRDFGVMTTEYGRAARDIMNPESAMWVDEMERTRLFGDRFDADQQSVVKVAELERNFGDQFGKDNYGSAEDWARRRIELGRIVETDPNAIRSLPAYEQEYISAYKDAGLQAARPYVAQDLSPAERGKELIEVPFTTRGPDGVERTTREILSYDAGAKILRARANLGLQQEWLSLRDAITNPVAMTADEVIRQLQDSPSLRNPNLAREARSRLVEGYAHAATMRGLDARSIIDTIISTRTAGLPTETIADLGKLSKELPYSPLSLDDLRDAAWPKGPTGRQLPRSQWKASRDFLNILESGKVGKIKAEFNRLRDAAVTDARFVRGRDALPPEFLALDREQVNLSLDMIRRRDNWLKSKYVKEADLRVTPKSFEKTSALVSRLERDTVPARFTPLVAKGMRERMTGIAEELTTAARIDPATALDVIDRVSRGNYDALATAIDNAAGATVDVAGKPLPIASVEDLLNAVRDEQIGTWQSLHAEGLDPIYVHHVPQGKSGFLQARGVNLSAKKPTWFNERSVDFSPHEGDMALGLQAQMFEVIQKKMEDVTNETIVNGNAQLGWNPIAKTRQQLERELDPIIQRRIAQTGMDHVEAANQVLKETWVRYDANSYQNYTTKMNVRGAKLTPGSQVSPFHDDLFIPRSIHDALTKMQEAPKAIAVWDPVMNVFRTSTLLLSPRWQIYNVLGNMLTITMAEGLGWVKHLPEAFEAAKAVGRGETPRLTGVGEMPATLRLSLGQQSKEAVELFHMGRQGKGVAGAVEATGETATKAMNWGKRAKSGVDYLSDLSIRLNAMIDDTTRIAGYMTAFRRHLGRKDAGALGAKFLEQGGDQVSWTDRVKIQAEQDMRKFSYNWDEMTPFERTVARRVFPFYGFFSHMMRYAYQYTMDHPLRMAVTASFARNELQDWGTGMPAYLHNMLLVGSMDEKGNRKAVNFAGWNPFADLATLFTPVGWLSQANPIISTLAEQFGIDPRTGEASLYPTATYNEQTGRLELKKRNVVESFIQNVVPQSQAVMNLTGGNSDFNQLARSNPSAANRLVASSLGLPVLVRDVNVPQEIAKAELARRNASRSALNEAIRTGTTGPVRTYPALLAQVEQLQSQVAQNPESYAQYQMPVGAPGYVDLLSGAGKAFIGAG